MSAKRKKPAKRRAEQVMQGVGVSPGIAIGPAHVVEPGIIEVPKYEIVADEIEAERARFAGAGSRPGNLRSG